MSDWHLAEFCPQGGMPMPARPDPPHLSDWGDWRCACCDPPVELCQDCGAELVDGRCPSVKEDEVSNEEQSIPTGMMRCTACGKDRPSSWPVGAGNIANPPQGPRCECGCSTFTMTIGPSHQSMPRESMTMIGYIVADGTIIHELPQYEGMQRVYVVHGDHVNAKRPLDERAAFEKWVAKNGVYLNDPDDGAKAAKLLAWQAWQTRSRMDSSATEQDRIDAAKYRALHTPEIHDFLKAVEREALYQREKWGADHDDGKTDTDYFWLLGYLAGKAVSKPEKQLHHIITTAAACLNWHGARTGWYVGMRPGIAEPASENLIGDAQAAETGAQDTA